MDFFDLVNKRRSIRKFTDEEVPEEVIKKSLKAALLAANSSNLQPWEFYWIKNKNKKEELIKACFSQNAAKTAKELVVAVSRIDTWKRNRDLVINYYKTKDKLLGELFKENPELEILLVKDKNNSLKLFSKFKNTKNIINKNKK